MEVGRRKALQAMGAAAVGGVAWSAPAIVSVDAVAAASSGCGQCGKNLVENFEPASYFPNDIQNAEYDPNLPNVGTPPAAVPTLWNTNNGFRVITYGSVEYPSTAPPGGTGVMFSGSNDGGAASPGTADQTSVSFSGACATEIDAGTMPFHMSGYLGGDSTYADTMSFQAQFLDASNVLISSVSLTPLPVLATSGFQQYQTSGVVPIGTRSVRFLLTATRTSSPAHARNTASAALLSFTLC